MCSASRQMRIAMCHGLASELFAEIAPQGGDLNMAGKVNYIFTVSMDVDADKEALLNDVYDSEHIPLILKVPGVVSAKRYKVCPLTMILGGEQRTIVMDGEPTYMAVYELESAEVLVSEAWAKAVDAGRWPTQVRPFTKNRRHVLRRMIG